MQRAQESKGDGVVLVFYSRHHKLSSGGNLKTAHGPHRKNINLHRFEMVDLPEIRPGEKMG